MRKNEDFQLVATQTSLENITLTKIRQVPHGPYQEINMVGINSE